MPSSQPSEREREVLQIEPQVQLGKYPILREIGRGATSHVYLARDPFADREVAIKVFMFDQNADPQTERMMHKAFLAEASLAGKLNHPHIVDILDAVAEPDHSSLVMEYVAGTALDAHADVATLMPREKVVEIIFKCIRALENAFQHGVIHRDIKPANILLSAEGETKVSDFGASFQQRLGPETTQLSGIGSPAYMSPEQMRLEPLTHQTDIYSLGVTMYRLLTGRLPYQATTQAALTYAILNTEPMRPSWNEQNLAGRGKDMNDARIAAGPAQFVACKREIGDDESARLERSQWRDGETHQRHAGEQHGGHEGDRHPVAP
jgi:serine/threonine protein kinase